ncbi:MAG: Fur family transcriptional regulator [Candidatus Puniceispirillaceae bacterium]
MTKPSALSGKYTTAILTYLEKQDTPKSAYEILDNVRDIGAKAPMQIYRALAKLEQAGLAHKLPKSNGWIACDGHDHNSVTQMLLLLSCQSCGTVKEIQNNQFQTAINTLTKSAQFSLPAQTIEVDGLCDNCHLNKGTHS